MSPPDPAVKDDDCGSGCGGHAFPISGSVLIASPTARPGPSLHSLDRTRSSGRLDPGGAYGAAMTCTRRGSSASISVEALLPRVDETRGNLSRRRNAGKWGRRDTDACCSLRLVAFRRMIDRRSYHKPSLSVRNPYDPNRRRPGLNPNTSAGMTLALQASTHALSCAAGTARLFGGRPRLAPGSVARSRHAWRRHACPHLERWPPLSARDHRAGTSVTRVPCRLGTGTRNASCTRRGG